MSARVIVLLVVLFAFVLLFVGVPIAVGAYVYKDAKQRSMSAVAWTLISAITPGFIGLIIYLIVRTGYPNLHCPQCKKPVREIFSLCPHCGAQLKASCLKCGFPLEYGWVNCPSCGEQIPSGQRERITHPQKDRGIGRLLAIIIAVPVALCIMLFAGFSVYTVAEPWGINSEYTPYIEKDELADRPELMDWINRCDSKGAGTYALKSSSKAGRKFLTQALVYRNDGNYGCSLEKNIGGIFLFSKPWVTFQWQASDGEGYSLHYLNLVTDKEIDIRMTEGAEIMDFETEETDNINFEQKELFIDVEIDNAVNTVYSVAISYYSGNEIAETETVANADGTSLKPGNSMFSRLCRKKDAITAFELAVYDADGHVIYKSGKYKVGERLQRNFRLGYNSSGALTMTEL